MAAARRLWAGAGVHVPGGPAGGGAPAGGGRRPCRDIRRPLAEEGPRPGPPGLCDMLGMCAFSHHHTTSIATSIAMQCNVMSWNVMPQGQGANVVEARYLGVGVLDRFLGSLCGEPKELPPWGCLSFMFPRSTDSFGGWLYPGSKKAKPLAWASAGHIHTPLNLWINPPIDTTLHYVTLQHSTAQHPTAPR